jgi:hypothetical protein
VRSFASEPPTRISPSRLGISRRDSTSMRRAGLGAGLRGHGPVRRDLRGDGSGYGGQPGATSRRFRRCAAAGPWCLGSRGGAAAFRCERRSRIARSAAAGSGEPDASLTTAAPAHCRSSLAGRRVRPAIRP